MPLRQPRRKGVPDHLGYGVLAPCHREDVLAWKGLEERCFARSHTPVLFRMQEPSLGWIHESACESGRDVVPGDAPIYVIEAVASAMALQDLFFAQVLAAAAVRWYAAYQRLDPRGPVLGNIVRGVSRTARLRKPMDDCPHGSAVLGSFRGRKRHLKSTAGHQDPTRSALRIPKSAASRTTQRGRYPSRRSLAVSSSYLWSSSSPRDVLEHQRLRSKGPNEANVVEGQFVTIVADVAGAVERAKPGEALAGRAAGDERELTRSQAKFPPDTRC